MGELTVADLRNKIIKKIENAKLQVHKFEEQLKDMDSIMQENESENSKEIIPLDQPQQLLDANHSDEEKSVGLVIKDAMLSIDKTAMFDVPRVVQMVRVKYPDIIYPELSKKASTVAARLEKRGDIELVRKGGGRVPHIYKRVK